MSSQILSGVGAQWTYVSLMVRNTSLGVINENLEGWPFGKNDAIASSTSAIFL